MDGKRLHYITSQQNEVAKTQADYLLWWIKWALVDFYVWKWMEILFLKQQMEYIVISGTHGMV